MAETGMRPGELAGMQTRPTWTSSGAWRRSGAARAARVGVCRSARRPGGLSTATYAHAAPTARPTRASYGLVRTTRRDFNYHGLRHALDRRAQQAGIANFHPHKMRHTCATRWLRAGGSEGGLMAVAGWSTRSMIDRYTAASASERAAAEARNLALGDL